MTKKDKNHHLRHRRRTWYFVAMVSGKRVKKFSSTSITEVANKIKASTLTDYNYKGAMNYYILPHFGNVPISQISFVDIETFMARSIEAMKHQRKTTSSNSPYIFLNRYNRPVIPSSMNFHFWKPALKKAGLKPRSLYQTRHTFATLTLDGGDLPGWVQSMIGHSSMKMILERYYSHIRNDKRDDGKAFMENVYAPPPPLPN